MLLFGKVMNAYRHQKQYGDCEGDEKKYQWDFTY